MSKISRARVIGDTHFGHIGVTRFTRDDGSKLRPFDTVEEMDEALVERWNSVVEPHDRVYLCGDVAINKKALPILDRLNGKKVLIAGNHDIFGAKEYLKYFEDVRAYKVIDGDDGPRAILSHIPIHTESLERYGLNIHGHLHARRVPAGERGTPPDPRYICVSAEHVDYTPVLIEDVIAEAQGKLNV